jgi:hypothetical protein
MSGIALTIQARDLDAAIRKADEIGDILQSHELRVIAGRAVQQAVMIHLQDLSRDAAHHRTAESLGANRTGLYQEAADATALPTALQPEADGISISIAQEGLAQRYFGGTIEAREGSFLTIPAQAAAYGHSAREFADLRLIMFPSGLAALVEKDKPSDEGSVLYWLVRAVTQQADPTVLPTEDEMLDPALEQVRKQIEVTFNRKTA